MQVQQDVEAERCFQLAAEQDPNAWETWANLGALRRRRNAISEAVACYARAVELAANNLKLGVAFVEALRTARQRRAAVDEAARLLAASPDDPEFLALAGNTAQEADDFPTALDHLRGALARAPLVAKYWNFLGIAEHRQGNPAAASNAFRSALKLDPDYADARFHLGMSRLLLEDYSEGWSEYEHRPGGRFRPRAGLPARIWHGQPLGIDESVLLMAEQGLGDNIQMLRFAGRIPEKFGGRAILLVSPRLGPLLESFPERYEIRTTFEPASSPTYCVPMCSLPSVFEYRPSTEPAWRPDLVAAPGRIAKCRERLRAVGSVDGQPTLSIGIAWQGDPAFPADSSRSVPLQCFAQLARIPGVRLVCLQQGHGREQLDSFRRDAPIVDFAEELDADGAFLDTLALMRVLDGVITSDTALAHVAGAAGVPVWIVLAHVPDWRWGLHGDRSEWYPSARLFRQPAHGDWVAVFDEVEAALREWVKDR